MNLPYDWERNHPLTSCDLGYQGFDPQPYKHEEIGIRMGICWWGWEYHRKNINIPSRFFHRHLRLPDGRQFYVKFGCVWANKWWAHHKNGGFRLVYFGEGWMNISYSFSLLQREYIVPSHSFFSLQGILDWLREILSVFKTWTLLQKGSTDRERITPWGDAREEIGDDWSQQWYQMGQQPHWYLKLTLHLVPGTHFS